MIKNYFIYIIQKEILKRNDQKKITDKKWAKGEEKEKGIENIFEEITSENFPNLKETDINIQEAQRAPNKSKPNRPTPRHIIIKIAKVKERILKAAREKQNINFKGTSIRISDDFSTETLQARRKWKYIFKVLKGKKNALQNTLPIKNIIFFQSFVFLGGATPTTYGGSQARGLIGAVDPGLCQSHSHAGSEPCL